MKTYSIGQVSQRLGIKIPTIRYYEGKGLVPEPKRSEGMQRRYDDRDLERLAFVKHARQLGFSLSAISKLMTLGEDDVDSCDQIDEIARANLVEVQTKIRLLKSLEKELQRIVNGCQTSNIDDCYVIESLQDHSNCETAHGQPGK